jgi:hypothetical protein
MQLKNTKYKKTLSTKPEVGGKMVYDFALKHYKEGDEDFVLHPLSYFFVENIHESCLFMILVLPECKSNLKKIKMEGKLDEENIRNIIQQLYRATFYLSYLRKIRNQNLNPTNILLDFETENGKVKNIKIKLTDLDVSSSCENDKSIDSFLFGRIVCFLCLDYSDFLQLSFMPIEDEETGNIIKNGINQFEVLRNAKECMNPVESSGIRHFYNVSHLSPLLIHRTDFISAGIPQDWFLDSNYNEEHFDEGYRGLGILA